MAVAGPGGFHGGGQVNDAFGLTFIPSSGDVVTVFMRNNGNPVDTDFMLIVTC